MAGSSGGGGGGSSGGGSSGGGGGGIRGGSTGSAYSSGSVGGSGSVSSGGSASAYEKWLAQQLAAARTAATTQQATEQALQEPGAPPPISALGASPVPVIPSLAPVAPVATTPIPPAPNVLTKEGAFQAHVDKVAQNYRDLVARNASPAEKAAAKQDYANALNKKAVFAREERAGLGNTRPMQETGAMTASQAFGMPQRVVSPAEKARIQHYNDMFVGMSQGSNPLMIGTATLAHREGEAGGMEVMSPNEEAAIRNSLNEKSKEIRMLRKAERRYTAKDEHEKAMDARKQRLQFETESGMKNPLNPKAGLDIDNALKTEVAKRQLLKDGSSLAGLAQQKITEQAVKKATLESEKAQARVQMSDPEWVAQRKREQGGRQPLRGGGGEAAQGQEDLAQAIERQRLLNEMWLEEQRKRTLAYM